MPETSNTPASPLTAGTAPDEIRTATSAIEGLLGDESEDPTTEAELDQEATAADAPDQEEVQGEDDAESEDEHAEPEETEEESAPAIRLSDGRTMTLEEVEKGLLRQDDYTRKTQALAEERRTHEASRQQQVQKLSEQETQVQQALERHAQMLQKWAPALPDPSLAMTDPSGWVAQRATYEAWKSEMDEVEKEQKASRQRQQDQVKQEQQQYLTRERELFYSTMPEMKETANLNAFNTDLNTIGVQHYGLTREDVEQLVDHRHARILKDAFAYRKLQAMKNAKGKTAPVPAKGPAPAGASPRPAQGVQKAKVAKQDLTRLRKTGRESDAADVIAKHFLR